jgi:integrase
LLNDDPGKADLIASNPAHIRAAGNSKRVHKLKPATLAELERIIANLPERYRLMVLLASWCALRVGELTELRRSDIDLKAGKINVSRGVVWVGGERVVDSPKSEAGRRTVAIPPHLLPVVKQHLSDHAARGKDGLLFPALVSGHQLSTALSTQPGAVPGEPKEGQIYGSMTCGTQVLCWRLRVAPQSRT